MSKEDRKIQRDGTNQSVNDREEKYRLIFESSPWGALHFDRNGIITACNDSFVQIIGSSSEVLIGLNMLHLSDKNLVAAVQEALEGKNGFYTGTYHSVTAEKTTPVRVHFAPFVNADGQRSGGIGMVEDITERELNQAAIAEKEAYFEKLFEFSPEGIVILDTNDCVIRSNNSFCNMFGYNPQEIEGKAINDLIVPEHLKDEGKRLTDTASGTIINHDTVRNKKDGTPVFVSILASPIIFKKGQVALYGIYRDISTQKQTEEALIEAKVKAQESDKLKTAFLNNLSHEVRTPMNAIMGFSRLLNEGKISEQQTNHLTSVILESSEQLLSIIDAIVRISTIETGMVEVENNEVDMHLLLNKTVEGYKDKANKKNIKLRCLSQLSDAQTVIISDELKIQHILSVLIDNAIKFTNNGNVEVGCSIDDASLNFYVADSGTGIDASHQSVIFKRFRQGVINVNQLHSGMGLGLPIAKGYVEALGGKIWLDSSSDSGTTFHFSIPYKPAKKQPVTEREQQKAMPVGQKTVLVAEDEEYNYDLIREILSFYNIEVLHAWNGKEAVKMVQQNPNIDLVIMDVKMPIMDGYEATKRIKTLNPELPVIALTAYALEGDRALALHNGCDDYLSKPVSIMVLKDMVFKYLT